MASPTPDKNIEKRVFQIELRADDADAERRTVTGYAAVFNSPSEDMGFIEYIERGAFKEALKTSDVRALFNHDPNYILARSASGTLKLQEDDKGLRYEFEAPATTFGNDFLTMLRRGDISQSSFGFTVAEQAWEEKKSADGDTQYIRRIKKVERLYDVSPVTYPAYPDTEVALRSKPAAETTESHSDQNIDEQNTQRERECRAREMRLKIAKARRYGQ
jgi:HK97 family phage prohead protease